MSGVCDTCQRLKRIGCGLAMDGLQTCDMHESESNYEQLFGTPERAAAPTDAIKSAASGADVNAYDGYLWLNTFKYIFRWPHKNGIEDLKKAQWYLNRLINDLEGDTQ